MTQDEIIRMAREAGFDIDEGLFPFEAAEDKYIGTERNLERFAALVAAHEREKLAEQEPLMITPGGGAFPFAVVGELEQAEQEPVATVKTLSMEDGVAPFHYIECNHLPEGTKLYTAPVRTKDLTDDEIETLAKQFVGQQSIACAVPSLPLIGRRINDTRRKSGGA